MSRLHIANGVSLPIDTVTQAIGILARRRAGKSYLARRFAEQLLKAEQQVVIVDPKGDWWGIRSAADGKGPGFKVTILGGEHADVPLEATGGELVAKLVVEVRVSVLLDLSLFSDGEVARFMADFLKTLYQMKAREQFRTPMMLIIDEADQVAPQQPEKNQTRMLGAANDIVRRGGQRGIGCMMVTQRSAVLSKNVLTQVELLIALRTIAPQDLKAIKPWIDVHGTEEGRKTLMDSLPSLPIGTAWYWSPGWPTDAGIFKQAATLPIETFDSGATPKAGQKQAKPKTMADVDLDAFRKRMTATIEKAKADDPRELRKRIAELERGVKASPAPGSVVKAPRVVKVETQVLRASDRKLLEKIATAAIRHSQEWKSLTDALAATTARIANAAAVVPEAAGAWNLRKFPDSADTDRSEGVKRVADGKHIVKVAASGPPKAFDSAASTERGKGEELVLVAVAQYPDGVTHEQLAILTGYKERTRQAYVQRLSAAGLVSRAGRLIVITDAGKDALPANFQPLPTGKELREHWLRTLPEGERNVLSILIDSHPNAVRTSDIETATKYSERTVQAYAQRLAARRVIERTGRGEIRASAELF